jgi:hypothetical protein
VDCAGGSFKAAWRVFPERVEQVDVWWPSFEGLIVPPPYGLYSLPRRCWWDDAHRALERLSMDRHNVHDELGDGAASPIAYHLQAAGAAGESIYSKLTTVAAANCRAKMDVKSD